MLNELPRFQTSYHHLAGDFEQLTVNLLQNLESRWNFGVSYLETYINDDNQAVYLLGGLKIVRSIFDSPTTDPVGFTIKLIEIGSDQVEVIVTSRPMNMQGFPLKNEAEYHRAHPQDEAQHYKLADMFLSYCEKSFGPGLLINEFIQSVIGQFRGQPNNQQRKRH